MYIHGGANQWNQQFSVEAIQTIETIAHMLQWWQIYDVNSVYFLSWLYKEQYDPKVILEIKCGILYMCYRIRYDVLIR